MTAKTILAAGAALACGLLVAAPLRADEGLQIPPVGNAAVKTECGACHLAYPPGLLPARSWSAIMRGLSDHFGDNAELDAAVARQIEDYLVANAAESGWETRRMLRRLDAGKTPLRITEMPWWTRKHERKDRVAPETLARKKAKFKGDCKACHQDAERGLFEEEEDEHAGWFGRFGSDGRGHRH